MKKVTHVAIVLDESGSMGRYAQQTVDGFNEQIQTLKQAQNVEHDVFVTFVKFSSDVEQVLTALPIVNAPVLTLHPDIKSGTINWNALKPPKLLPTSYYPAGGTALRLGIKTAADLLLASAVDTDDTAYLVLTLTDGEENASHERCTPAQLKTLITQLEGSGKWTFTLIGANVNLEQLTQEIGLQAGNVVAAAASPTGQQAAWLSTAGSSERYMQSREQGVMRSVDFYDAQNDTLPDTAPVVEISDEEKKAILEGKPLVEKKRDKKD